MREQRRLSPTGADAPEVLIPGYPKVVSVDDSMKLSSVVYDDGVALEGGVGVAASEGESGAWGALRFSRPPPLPADKGPLLSVPNHAPRSAAARARLHRKDRAMTDKPVRRAPPVEGVESNEQ
jgi:hypothetical protein